VIIQAIVEGLEERKRDKEDEAEKEAAVAKAKADAPELVTVERAPNEGGRRTRKGSPEVTAAVVEAAAETGTEPAVEE